MNWILCRILLYVTDVDSSTAVHFGNISFRRVNVYTRLVIASAGRRSVKYVTQVSVVLRCIPAFHCLLGLCIYYNHLKTEQVRWFEGKCN